MEEKEIVDKVMRIKGGVRGEVLRTEMRYIREHEGEEGVKKVEAQTKRMGYPIDHDKIRGLGWYPIGLEIVILLATKKALNWNDEQIARMGRAMPKFSFITKLMLKYFVSLKRVAKEVPKYWRKQVSIGSMETTELNEEKKYGVLCLKDFEFHPLFCKVIQNYIWGALGLIRSLKNLTIEESKCVHRGDKYHEFVIRWED